MASALRTDIPTGAALLKAESPQGFSLLLILFHCFSLAANDDSVDVPASKGRRKMKDKKASKLHKYPLTGTEVVLMFAEKSNTEELFYLKEVEKDARRPYDLQVVHALDAGPEHYIFSPNSVLHVTATGFGGVVSLAEWYREYVLWTALQEIHFFKNFRLRKAFSCWHKTVRVIHFQHKCDKLEDLLLVAVPQFRTALHLLSGLLEELQGMNPMPLDGFKTLSLLEFNKVLITKNEEFFLSLQKLSKYHAALLNEVKDKSYENHKELQMQLRLAKKIIRSSEPIHLVLAHKQKLKKQLAQSENILKKLGNFAALVHQMIVQSLVTVTQQDARSFLRCLKSFSSQQCSVFYTELCFSANSQLTIEPPIWEFHKTLNKSFLRTGSTLVQMCDNLGFFLEISNKECNSDQDLTSDVSCIQCSTVAGTNTVGMNDQPIRSHLFHSESTFLMVESKMMDGCYYPLSKTKLEWYININDVTEQVETEQAKILQDTELEMKHMRKTYTWLKDIHLFVSQWSAASLESMKGQPASVYEEHIKKLHGWAQRIHTVSPSTYTSSHLVVIDSTKTKETLLWQLSLIKEEVQELLVDQMKRQSESLIGDMEKMTAQLKEEPEDFSKYALMVRKFMKMLADMQSHLEYILSLRDAVYVSYRKMTEQEISVEEKMLGLWDNFIPLLKQAESLVSQSLPAVTNAMDTMFSFLVCDLKSIVFKATSGPFLDPSQTANDMVSKLKYMCEHVQTLSTKLDELNSSSQSMQEQKLDLTSLAADVKKVLAREELWQLKAECTAWTERWNQLPLSEVSVSQAQEKIAIWKNQTPSLTNIIPATDAVLEETSAVLESLSQQVEVLAKLKSSSLREKHWTNIFQGMGLLDVPEKEVTVGHFTSRFMSGTHQQLIQKICREAQLEWDLEKGFQTLCLRWRERLFQLHELVVPACPHCEAQNGLNKEEMLTDSTLSSVQTTCQCRCNDARVTIIGLETLFAEIQKDLITLSTMLRSPHSVEFHLQLEDLVQSLKDLAKLLDLFERYQQTWAFLTKIFREASNDRERADLLKDFQQADDAFKEMMHSVSKDPHVWNLVCSETNHQHGGDSLWEILMDGLFAMECISHRMHNVFQTFREQFPRLYFLNDREIMELLSFHPLESKQQLFLRKCFKGVQLLEVEVEKLSNTSNLESFRPSSENIEQMKVLGVFGSLQEHIAFQPPLGPNPDTLVWLCAFEKHLELSMIKLIKQCAVLRSQLDPASQDFTYYKAVDGPQSCNAHKMEDTHPLLDLLLDFPLQCLLVVEEAFWCRGVLQALKEGSPLKLKNLKTQNSSMLKILSNAVRNRVQGSEKKSLISKYAMMCLRALVQLAMNHGQQLSQLMGLKAVLESSFEWLSTMKYHINPGDGIHECSDISSCYVDILDHRFQYGFEYYGPDDWLMVQTPSTERATLGIVLALTRYRSGFVSGPSMSGRTNTVIQLGKALGQLLAVKQCSPNTGSAVVQRMLLGAIQTGAWLLLESVDLLSQDALSVLGQLLTDIRQCYLNLQRNTNQRLNKEPECKTAATVLGCINIANPGCHFQLLGKQIFLHPSYGCVLSSSNQCVSKIPDSLRFAARPVSLTHPDYRIVAEVTLASLGFLEAMSLSHRLVCLITLIKDSECLPDLFNDNQSCFLVVLQKIISASEIYLHHAVSQREISFQDKVIAAEHSSPLPVESLADEHFWNDKKETTKLPKLRNSQLLVIQALMEETAIVKAILSVLIPEHKKASQFYTILKDTFPIASQFPDFQKYIPERENNQLQDAVVKEMQELRLYYDMQAINQALTLYQALKFSQMVILIGPSGSGKTTCYSILAGAVNRLASTKDAQGTTSINNRDASHVDPQIPALNWCYIDTLHLFPNAMSHDELFGSSCEKSGWKDGAIAKVLKDSRRYDRTCFEIHKNEPDSKAISLVKWLVMDGEPIGQPCWLDYLTTLCNSQDPHLCLPSGETVLSLSQVNLLSEMTDLQDASPSAVTRCGLVYFTQTDLWKAIWRSEMNALSVEHKLDQGVQQMWNRLADDLFPSTLSLLGQHALTSANHFEGGSCKNYGLQEITSFVRILRALLKHFVKQLKKPDPSLQNSKRGGTNYPGTNTQGEQDPLTRNLFLVAYVWGFGGHLHYRHWPQFDMLARQVLFASRYKIQVPDQDSLFEHFIGTDTKMCSSETHLTDFITPKLGTYRHLVNLMLEANQPLLLAGEPGSGKTTLSNSLLRFDLPHIANPLMSSRELCIILKNISSQRNCKHNVCSKTKQPGLLLFVDDLHEAPCDLFRKASTALETLRQSMSKGGILTFDSYSFEYLSSGAVSYLATTDLSRLDDPGSHGISLRLSRLFSIFVLPSLSEDAIFSFHSPWLKMWLREMPLTCSGEEMSKCVIAATKYLYDAVCEQFQPSAQRPFFLFSHHDIQKVFSGMYLWKHDVLNAETHTDKNLPPGSPPTPSMASVFNIVHLWMHECLRTFSDRLCSEDEMDTFLSLVSSTAATHYGCHFVQGTQMDTVEVKDVQISLVGSKCASHANLHPGISLAGQADVQKVHAESRDFYTEEASPKSHIYRPEMFKDMEEDVTRLVYAPEFFEASDFMKQQQDIKDRSLYQQQDFDLLQQKLHAFIDREVSDVDNITSRYIVHRQGMSQLLHLLRALLLPGGHGVLIGSDRRTGRKTAVRLAAHITGYQLIELDSSNEAQLHEILKEARTKANMDGVKVILLVHENISLPARQELLMAMAQKAFPVLYREEKLSRHVSRVTSLKHSNRYLMHSWINEKSLGEDYKNIHVFLLMPFTKIVNSEIPTNEETQGWSAQLAKALKLSCCVEVYQPWSSQTLAELAVKCLRTYPYEATKDCSEDSLSVAMTGIHQSACRHASVFLKSHPFSPATYLEFIACFGYLCNKLHNQWQREHDRIATTLARLDVVNNTSKLCKEHLKQLQEQIDNARQLEKELLGVVEEKKIQLEMAVEKYAVGERKLNQLEEQIIQSQHLIKPVFLSALEVLNCLNPSDLEEVRHYRDPPDRVVKIMDAICLMFNRPAGWESAKQLLGQPSFFQELEFFDRSSLTKDKLQQLGQIVQSPQFVPESVREVSKACESLCRWVQAVYEYCSMQHNLLVRQQLEVQAGEARRQLHLWKQQEKEADQCLEDKERQLQTVRNELEVLICELYKAESQEEAATTCAVQVEMHVRNWRTEFQEAELHRQNTAGDALILAATMSYLGPFEAALRTELLNKWRDLCLTGSININPRDLRSSLFTDTGTESISPSPGFPITVTERLQLPFGWILGMKEWQLEDTLSTRLVVKLLLWGFKEARVHRWPLLADTDQHSERSSQQWFTTGENANLEKELGFGLVLCADDLELLDRLELAAEKGWKVLVTHVERAKPSPEFLAKLVRPNRTCFHGLRRPPQAVHPDFCLVLSTPLPVRLLSSGIDPSILAQVLVVDLSLSSEEIRELMLTQLLQSECRELLIQHTRFLNYNQFLQAKLVSAEEALMDYILKSGSLLFKDSDFLPRVADCQEEMRKLKAEINQLSEELDYHKSLLASPRQLMKLAAALYQALQAVSRLSPAYYFSLQGFIKVMQEAFSAKGGPLVSYTTRKAAQSTFPETTSMMVQQLLIQYRPSLFKRHFAVLKLLVSLAVLEHNQLCSEAEKLVFLRGLEDIEDEVTDVKTSVSTSDTALKSSSDLPSWIPTNIHTELLFLEKISCFKGLIDSICASPTQWQEYLCFTSSTIVGNVPCCSHSHLSLLQRAILWKTIRPDCLEHLGDSINTCSLCLTATTSAAPDSEIPVALSKHLARTDGAIILTLPNSEGDMQISVWPLRFIHQLIHKDGQNEVQVEVISFGGLCDNELILSALDKAVSEGRWLVFNNCHLLENWDDKVVARLSQLTSPFKGRVICSSTACGTDIFTVPLLIYFPTHTFPRPPEEKRLIHPCFRLWFVNQENAAESLPAVVRMCALQLCCDSPWDLKEEMFYSFQQVLSVSHPQSWSDVADDNKEVLLRCAIFHSVLLQRRTYTHFSFGRMYHWSQDDLLTLLDAYISIASQCHDKVNVLHYMAASVIHGGHIIDSTDAEVVQSVARCCFATESSLSGSGPGLLSDMISGCGHFDLSGLLQVLEQRFRDLAISDPDVLGFSTDVAPEVAKMNSYSLNVLLRASQTPLGGVRSFSPKQVPPVKLPTYLKVRERLQALKNYLTHKKDSAIRDVGAASRSPLRDFLEAEWDHLIDLVALLLSHLQQPVQYNLSSTSLIKFTDLSRLEKRAELLSAYLGYGSASDPPGAYRLAAFQKPRGLLLALMRGAARENYKYISDIILHFQVLRERTCLALLPPDAIYLFGLQLTGASWDPEIGALQDAVSPRPFSMPIVCVKAQVRTGNSAAHALTCKSSYLTDTGNLQAAPTAPHLPVYHCPLYLNEECESGTWGLSDINIITKVPLRANFDPALCSLRRVRLLSTL
ncbi:dynein heavy chain domain-containing protein 1 [Fundulus diaphanus]